MITLSEGYTMLVNYATVLGILGFFVGILLAFFGKEM